MKFEDMVNFQHTFNIDKYLGYPLLSSRVTKANFSLIIDKINFHLNGWKDRLLNRLGMKTLAKLCA